MTMKQDWFTVGKLVSAQGLKGELRVNPTSDFPERFTEPGKRWLQKDHEEPEAIELVSGRQLSGKSLYIIRFAGIKDRSAAESLIGKKLLVPSHSRPNLAKGEFHLMDLVGLEAKLVKDETSIGIITGLINAGNDLLEIDLKNGKRVLVPFVQAIVPEIDIQKGWAKLSPPPGLLEL